VVEVKDIVEMAVAEVIEEGDGEEVEEGGVVAGGVEGD
jgi:hypothetical protein